MLLRIKYYQRTIEVLHPLVDASRGEGGGGRPPEETGGLPSPSARVASASDNPRVDALAIAGLEALLLVKEAGVRFRTD
jgi:hypothetical protein